MAKIHIELPEKFTFSTQIDVLIQHINRADHLANEHLIAMLNEARTRFTQAVSASSSENIDFRQFINADLAVIYKAEGHYGDTMNIEIAADDFSRYGCDFVYRVTEVNSGKLIAIAKTAMLQFNYQTNKLEPVPESFEAIFEQFSHE